MGDYTGVATRLRVKKTAPESLITFLDQYYTRSTVSTNITVQQPGLATDMADELWRLVNCSAYMEGWMWRVKEDEGDYWLYESRGSCKNAPTKAFKALVRGIVDYLVLDIGDIVYSYTWEYDTYDTLFYWDGKDLVKRKGLNYASSHGFITDSDHPRRDNLCNADKAKLNNHEFDSHTRHAYGSHLLWTVAELDAELKRVADEEKKAADREDKRMRRLAFKAAKRNKGN